MSKKILMIGLVMTLLLGACASRASTTETPMEAPAADIGYGAPEEGKNVIDAGGNAQAVTVADTGERLVIKQAYMEISVASPEEAMVAVSNLANSLGGYVVSSNSWTNTNYQGVAYKQTSVAIRIPSEKLDDVMQSIREMAANGKDGVISENVSGQDVTSDYTDSQSRLRNLEAAEAQLMELLKNTTDLSATMEVFRELTSVREQIEVLKGHIKYLEESSSLSSVTVTFVAAASLQPIEIGGWEPKGIAKTAIQQLIKTLQSLGSGLIWFGLYCLPFLIPLSIALYFVIKAIRKHRAARKMEKVPVAEPTQEKPQA